MSDSTTPQIGYVCEVGNARMIARFYPGREAEGEAIGDRQLRVGQIGSYVVVRQHELAILAQVLSASRETDGKTEAGEESCMVSLMPLGEIDAKGAFLRGVRYYPTVGAPVCMADIRDIETLFKAYHRYGYTVGYLATLSNIEVSLNPSTLFGRHFAILGQSGSGKSWAVTSLIQRAVAAMPKAHIILLDLHGEYCWRDEHDIIRTAFHEEIVRHIDARELEIPYWLMTYAELVDLLIDRTDRDATMQMAFLREVMYHMKKKAAAQLGVKAVSIDSPIYFSMVELYQQFKSANEQRGDFGKSKGALYGLFDEFLVKLQSRLNDVRYDFLLKPKRRTNSESLTSLLRDFVGLGQRKRQVTVIDLSYVPFDVRPSVSAQIGRLAFEFNYWNPRNREFPILLLCEEAHAYIPREGGTQYDGTRKSMERIAKEGRKYGVGLGVVSQRPHELSETVLSQCGTFICLRITNPDDQAYIRALVPEGESNLVDILTVLGRGEAVVMGEASPLPTRFQLYKPDPPPNSNDVDFHTYWKSGPDDLDIDDIVFKWRRQGR